MWSKIRSDPDAPSVTMRWHINGNARGIDGFGQFDSIGSIIGLARDLKFKHWY